MKNYFFLFIVITIVFGTYSWCLSASRELNIVSLGDSITFGTGDPSKKGYIERLKTKIEKAHSSPIHLSNYGVPKYTTKDVLRVLKDKENREQLKKAHYIILFIGTNDFRKSAKYQFSPLNEDVKVNGKQAFIKSLQEILHTIRDDNPTAPIFLLGLYQPYTEYLNHSDIQKVIESWNSHMKVVAGNFHEVHFVPTMDLFLNQRKTIYFSDSLHPNPQGYSLIAERLFQEMEKVY